MASGVTHAKQRNVFVDKITIFMGGSPGLVLMF